MSQSIQIGIELASLHQPFKKALHTAAQLEAETLEIDARNDLRLNELSETGLRQLRKMLQDLNLQVAAVSFPTRRGYHSPEDLDRRIEATRHAMRVAFQLGATLVVNRVGEIPPESEGAPWDLLVESLTELGRYGQHVGARLAAETGTESGQDMKRLLTALPEGCLAIALNPGSLLMHGYAPDEAVQALGPHIAHVHARDAVHRRDRQRGGEVTLGEGAVDFPELFALLETYRYRGAVTVQRWPDDLNFVQLVQSLQFLKNLRS